MGVTPAIDILKTPQAHAPEGAADVVDLDALPFDDLGGRREPDGESAMDQDGRVNQGTDLTK